MDSVENTFPPEFINRLDQVIMFEPLSKEHLEKIVQIQIDQAVKRLKNQNITLEIDNALRKYLSEKNFPNQAYCLLSQSFPP